MNKMQIADQTRNTVKYSNLQIPEPERFWAHFHPRNQSHGSQTCNKRWASIAKKQERYTDDRHQAERHSYVLDRLRYKHTGNTKAHQHSEWIVWLNTYVDAPDDNDNQK